MPSQIEHRVDHLERGVVVAHGERRILEPLLCPPTRDGDADRSARSPELAEDLQLQRFERREPLVAVEQQPSDAEQFIALTTCADRVEHRGHVCHQRGVAHVAEVDDAGDAARVVDERVVAREIAVHHLRTQRWPAWQHDLVEAVDHGAHRRPRRRIGDRVEHRPRVARMLHVPGHHPHRARVDEATHRAPETSGRATPGAQRPVVEQTWIVASVAGHEVVHPRPVDAEWRLPRPATRSAGLARHRERPCDREVGIDTGDVGHDLGFHVEGVHRLGGVRHLHHGQSCTTFVEQQERTVALAAEVDGRDGSDAEAGRDINGVDGGAGGCRCQQHRVDGQRHERRR